MRRSRRSIPLVLALTGLVAGPASAQDVERALADVARIIGRVIEHPSNRPVAGAIVSIIGVEGRVLTDDRGAFSLRAVPAGSRVLVVEMIGYATRSEPIALRGGAVHDVEVKLAQEAIPLDPIEVSTRSGFLESSGFYERQRSGGGGTFITRQDIDRRRASDLTDMLRGVPGLTIHLIRAGLRHVRFNRSFGETFAFDVSTDVLPGCEPDLYVDGALYRERTPQNASEHRVDGFDVLAVPEIEGIEVYSGPDSPLRYRHPCGVILVWSRRGTTAVGASTAKASSDVLLPDLPDGTRVRITPRTGDRYAGLITTSAAEHLDVDTDGGLARTIEVSQLRRIERSLGRADLAERTWRGARWGLVVGLVGIAVAAAGEEFSQLDSGPKGRISDTSPRKPAFGAKVIGVTTLIGGILGGSLWHYEHWIEVRLR